MLTSTKNVCACLEEKMNQANNTQTGLTHERKIIDLSCIYVKSDKRKETYFKARTCQTVDH